MNTEPTALPPQPAPAVDAAGAADAVHAALPELSAPASDEAPAAPVGLSPAECGARLATLFPALFVAPGAPGPYKPIKLRIHTDIQARAPGEFSKRVLGIFFSRYTTTNAYLKALAAPGAQRFDLDGTPAGEIAEEHRAAAVEEIARRQAIAAERRAMQTPRRAPARQRDTPADGAPPPPQPPPRENRANAYPREDRAGAYPRQDRAGAPPRAPRPPRDGMRRDRPEEQGRAQRADRAQRPAAPAHRPPRRDDTPRAPVQAQAPAAPPADAAQRERALLLRSFEASPLSKANFCTLKRISEAELDAALVQARAERR